MTVQKKIWTEELDAEGRAAIRETIKEHHSEKKDQRLRSRLSDYMERDITDIEYFMWLSTIDEYWQGLLENLSIDEETLDKYKDNVLFMDLERHLLYLVILHVTSTSAYTPEESGDIQDFAVIVDRILHGEPEEPTSDEIN